MSSDDICLVEEVGEEEDEGEGVHDDDVVEELWKVTIVTVVNVDECVQQYNHELRLKKTYTKIHI